MQHKNIVDVCKNGSGDNQIHFSKQDFLSLHMHTNLKNIRFNHDVK